MHTGLKKEDGWGEGVVWEGRGGVDRVCCMSCGRYSMKHSLMSVVDPSGVRDHDSAPTG